MSSAEWKIVSSQFIGLKTPDLSVRIIPCSRSWVVDAECRGPSPCVHIITYDATGPRAALHVASTLLAVVGVTLPLPPDALLDQFIEQHAR